MKLGLTGSIASGKSTVSQLLVNSGWKVLDTDQVVHDLYAPEGKAVKKVVDAFGDRVLNKDSSINRAVLGEVVFNDLGQLHQLNSIVHPLVRETWQQALVEHEQAISNASPSLPVQPVVIVIPLLFETHAENSFDFVACIACSLKEQLKRLRGRGIEYEAALKRIALQMPVTEKIQRSDAVVWNDGSKELLVEQVKYWIQQVQQREIH